MERFLLTVILGNTLMGRADGVPPFPLLGMKQRERSQGGDVATATSFHLKESSISSQTC